MSIISSTYRFIALSLAFLMFITSLDFAVDMHYCGGQLKSLSFFGKAKTCHEKTIYAATSGKGCQHHQNMMEQNKECSISKKDCCENRTLHVQSDQDQNIQANEVVLNKQFQQFLTAYVVSFFTTLSFENDVQSFIQYKSPPILRDIPVLIQSFLL